MLNLEGSEFPSAEPASPISARTRALQIVAALALMGFGVIVLRGWIERTHASGQRRTLAALILQMEQQAKTYYLDHGHFPSPQVRGHDLWSRPFIHRVIKSGKGFDEMRIYSVGPNGVDEGGSGDDISSDS